MDIKLSAVIVTKNEERNIAECINTVSFSDEVLVVDMESSDNTVAIAKKLGAKITVSSGGKYKTVEYNKNIGFKKAKGAWILSLDADQRVSRKLAKEIQKTVLSEKKTAAYKVKMPTYYWGKWLYYGMDLYQVKLFRKKSCRGYIPPTPHSALLIDGPIDDLVNPIYHLGHKGIENFIAGMNLYTSQTAKYKFNSRIAPLPWLQIIKNIIANFYYSYIKLKGYKDGVHGLTFIILMSIYMLVEELKVWELYIKKSNDNLHKFDRNFFR